MAIISLVFIFCILVSFVLFRARVVRCLACDGDVVRVTLHDAGISNAHELCIVQVLYILCSAVAHTRTQTADELINDFLNGAFVRYAAGNAFGNQFLGFLRVAWK